MPLPMANADTDPTWWQPPNLLDAEEKTVVLGTEEDRTGLVDGQLCFPGHSDAQ